MENISVIIPVRVDSKEREINLHCVVRYLLQTSCVHIDILEADSISHFKFENNPRISYLFVKDDNPVFHRTHYLNVLLKNSVHSIVGVWDADVIIPEEQLLKGIKQISEGCIMCFPYDGNFRFLSANESNCIRNNKTYAIENDMGFRMMGRPSVGGAFLVNRDAYLMVGGENENFYGWGPEDAERVKRLEILELPIARIDGALYHLHHPSVITNEGEYAKRLKHNKKMLLNICRKTKQELEYLLNNHSDLFSYMREF